MLDFRKTLEACRNKMQEGVGPSPEGFPEKCVKEWERLLSYAPLIDESIQMIEVRDKAWLLVKNFEADSKQRDPKSKNFKIEEINNFEIYGVELIFPAARNLLLSAYMSSCWAIYDKLSHVCGRMSGTSSLANNDDINPKLFQGLMNKQKGSGFAVPEVLSECYEPSLQFSYAVRNLLVHEGWPSGEKAFFQGDNVADGFTLTDAFLEWFEPKAKKKDFDSIEYSKKSCLLSDTDWKSKDLLKILETFNAENDQMFAALTKWCVMSTIGQMQCFLERYQ